MANTATRFITWPKVQDEGTDKVTEPDILNFVGSGVVVTESPSRTAVITINGGAGAQSGGSDVLDPALKFNFNANDFTITDEGSSIAGVAITPHAKIQYVPHPITGLWTAQTYGVYGNLNVYVLPVKLEAQADVIALTFNVSTLFSGDNDMFDVGLYNSAKQKVLDGLWQDVHTTGNKTGVFTATDIYAGQFFLAWTSNKTGNSGQLWGISLDTGNQGLLNSGGSYLYCGLAANQATASGLGTAGLPATLGNISAPGIGIGFPATVIASAV